MKGRRSAGSAPLRVRQGSTCGSPSHLAFARQETPPIRASQLPLAKPPLARQRFTRSDSLASGTVMGSHLPLRTPFAADQEVLFGMVTLQAS